MFNNFVISLLYRDEKSCPWPLVVYNVKEMCLELLHGPFYDAVQNMDEKNMHNLFLKNMSGLIESAKHPETGANSLNP